MKKLKEQRDSELEKTGKTSSVPSFRTISLKDIKDNQNFDAVKSKADFIESEAKNIQKYLNITGGGTVKEKEQVNDMLFQSMNVKLSLLQSTVKEE